VIGSFVAAEQIVPEPRLERVPEALWRGLLDGVLVLTLSVEQPLRITTPGDVVWRLLASPLTATELIRQISNQYHTTERAVRTDIEQVLAALMGVGAIRQIPSSSG
jgi:hypothetical protein